MRPADGKVAVLLPGLGAVATTTIAGVALVRRRLAAPLGSLTQMGTIAVGEGALRAPVSLGRLVPLAGLDQIEFGAWDIFPDDAYQAARHAKVLGLEHLEAIADELEAVEPMAAVFYPEYVRRLHGTHVKTGRTKADMVEQLRSDIRSFVAARACSRAVAVWCGSTEAYCPPRAVHHSIAEFERGLERSDPGISSSQIYAWAFIKERVPFANGSPNFMADFPAARELARETRVAMAGKDFKTGQTLLKTIVAPGLKNRLLGVRGWYSTNILGNRDGEVLDDPESFRSKEASKLGVLESIFGSSSDEALYGEFHHKVRIDYFPPRGDDKQAWDSIDLLGWLGYGMQLKIDFLCKDSILAAPLVLDLALLLDLAQRAGCYGPQDWLGFYFKCPMPNRQGDIVHDLSLQRQELERALLEMSGQSA